MTPIGFSYYPYDMDFKSILIVTISAVIFYKVDFEKHKVKIIAVASFIILLFALKNIRGIINNPSPVLATIFMVTSWCLIIIEVKKVDYSLV